MKLTKRTIESIEAYLGQFTLIPPKEIPLHFCPGCRELLTPMSMVDEQACVLCRIKGVC